MFICGVVLVEFRDCFGYREGTSVWLAFVVLGVVEKVIVEMVLF